MLSSGKFVPHAQVTCLCCSHSPHMHLEIHAHEPCLDDMAQRGGAEHSERRQYSDINRVDIPHAPQVLTAV